MTFLDGIKKYGTGMVNPSAFNRIINDWGQDEWLYRYLRKGPEITETVQEKLSMLRVITDDEFAYTDRIDLTGKKTLNSIPPNNLITMCTNIMGVSSTSAMPNSARYFMYPYNNQIMVNGIFYPAMAHLLGIAFKLKYKNNDCYEDGTISDWLNAHVLFSDQKPVLRKNPWRKPTDERLYYEIMAEHFVLTNDTDSEGYRMRLDYIRKPRRIFFNTENGGNPNLEQEGVPDYTGGSTGTPGSVNCELSQDIRMEIVNIAIRTFVERIKDPRYQSYINE
jgi:hypothetical protein